MEPKRRLDLEFILVSGVAAGENFDHDANLPSRKEFDALVESSFLRNAVPTMTLDEANTYEAKPRLGLPYACLMLVVDVEKSQGANSYIYRMDIDMYEDAVVSRTGKIYPVSIWHRSALGSAVVSAIKPAVNAAIGKLIDEFGGEYLAANPLPLRPGKSVSSSSGRCTSRAHHSTEIYAGIRQQEARRLRRA